MIQDVVPSPAYVRGYGKTALLKELTNEQLVDELHKRGVGIDRVFAQFYAIEAMSTGKDWEINGDGEEGQHGRPLTVGDVELAGLAELPETPNPRPF